MNVPVKLGNIAINNTDLPGRAFNILIDKVKTSMPDNVRSIQEGSFYFIVGPFPRINIIQQQELKQLQNFNKFVYNTIKNIYDRNKPYLKTFVGFCVSNSGSVILLNISLLPFDIRLKVISELMLLSDDKSDFAIGDTKTFIDIIVKYKADYALMIAYYDDIVKVYELDSDSFISSIAIPGSTLVGLDEQRLLEIWRNKNIEPYASPEDVLEKYAYRKERLKHLFTIHDKQKLNDISDVFVSLKD